MYSDLAFGFTNAICRKPAISVKNGLRDSQLGLDPDPVVFADEHSAYVSALKNAGLTVKLLEPSEQYPDSVFVEDPCLCLPDCAIVLRPGALSRAGEAELMNPVLAAEFDDILHLSGPGFVDGGDIMVTNREILVGLSARTDKAGFQELAELVATKGYKARLLQTPKDVLHFKTASSILSGETVFATRQMIKAGVFDGYKTIEVPEGEEPAANAVRINEVVLLSSGYPKTQELLQEYGYTTISLSVGEAAKVDGGLSCMSLRYRKK